MGLLEVRRWIPTLSETKSSWPLRTALATVAGCCAFYLNPERGFLLEGRLLGPVISCLCTSQTLGETLMNSWIITLGILFGTGISWCAITIISGLDVTCMYAAQAVLSLVLLYMQTSVLQTRVCWLVLVTSMASAIQNLRDHETPARFFPAQVALSGFFGVGCAVVVSYLPVWSCSACIGATKLLASASDKAATSIGELSHAFGMLSALPEDADTAEASCAAPRPPWPQQDTRRETTRAERVALAEKCLRESQAEFATAKKLQAVVWWEKVIPRALAWPVRMMGVNTTCCWGCGDKPAALAFEARVAALSSVIMMAGGMLRVLKAARLEEFVSRGLPLPQHLLGQAKVASGAGDEEGASDLVGLAQVMATQQDRVLLFRSRMSKHVLETGECLRECLSSGAAAPSNTEGTAALERLVESERRLEEGYHAVRKELYYTEHPESQRMETLVMNAFGLPVDYVFFCFCLQMSSHAVIDLKNSLEVDKPPQSFIKDLRERWSKMLLQLRENIRLVCSKPSALGAFFGLSNKANKAARMVYALKLSAAIVVSMYLGEMYSGSALWAGMAVAVIGPRDSLRSGGSFKIALLRINGTVIGSLFGFFVAIWMNGRSFQDSPVSVGLGHLALLGVWVFFCGFVRASKATSYAGFVAQYTPFVMIELPVSVNGDGSPAVGYELWAFRRIQQNLLACAVFVLVEVLVFPTFSSNLLHSQLMRDLRRAASTARLMWDCEMGSKCGKCAANKEKVAAQNLEKQTRGIQKQRELLDEVRHEPEWMTKETDFRTYDRLIDLQDHHVLGLLTLMQVVLSRWSHHLETSKDVREHTSRVLAPLKPRVKILSIHIADWFEKIADGLEDKADPTEEYQCEELATQALHLFELKLFSSVSMMIAQIRSKNEEPPPHMASLFSLIFLTRELVHACSEVSRYAGMVKPKASPHKVRDSATTSSSALIPNSNVEEFHRWERIRLIRAKGLKSYRAAVRWLEEVKQAEEEEETVLQEGGNGAGDHSANECACCGACSNSQDLDSTQEIPPRNVEHHGLNQV